MGLFLCRLCVAAKAIEKMTGACNTGERPRGTGPLNGLGNRFVFHLWMARHEMPENHQEFACVLLVATAQGVMDIVAHHVANFLRTVRLLQQVPGDCSSCNFRHVFMLSNSHNLLFGEATQSD